MECLPKVAKRSKLIGKSKITVLKRNQRSWSDKWFQIFRPILKAKLKGQTLVERKNTYTIHAELKLCTINGY